MPGKQPPQRRSTPPQKEPAKDPTSKGYQIRVSWDIPQDMLLPSATHIIVQRDGPDFIINFFELRPPLLLGTEEQKLQQLKKIDSVHAKCVARLLISADRMPQFLKAFSDAQELSAEPSLKEVEADAND